MGAIAIYAYDAAWPERFEVERRALLGAIGGALTAIEHVGSTAVPGLAAAPIIDMLGGLHDATDAERCQAPLAALGFREVVDAPGHFIKESADLTFHLQVLADASAVWASQLLFRDYLRTHPKHALHYQALKYVLAERCGSDRAAYVSGKSGFVSVIEELARTRS
jgi:GrpB-like predicted nucleotidyltransferase (UPF0157 family)